VRKALSAVLTTVALILPGGQALAAPSLPSSPGARFFSAVAVQVPNPDRLSVSPTTLTPGAKVTISGSGCPAGSTVSLLADARASSVAHRLGSVPTAADGSFDGTTAVPGGIGLGSHTLSAFCSNRLVGSERIRLVTQGFVALGGIPGTLAVSRSAVAAGGTVKIVTQRCGAGAVTAALDDTRVTVPVPAPAGAGVEADVTIPASTPPGMHTLFTHCGGLLVGAATLRVIAAGSSLPAPVDGSPVPRTDLLLGVATGVVLVVLLGAITLWSLRRHRARTATPGYFDLPNPQRQIR
jgi:hypothetical protein